MPDVSPGTKDPLHAVSIMFCAEPPAANMTPEQLAALHVFKHEFLAAGYRLYERISPKLARPILSKLLTQVSQQLLRDPEITAPAAPSSNTAD